MGFFFLSLPSLSFAASPPFLRVQVLKQTTPVIIENEEREITLMQMSGKTRTIRTPKLTIALEAKNRFRVNDALIDTPLFHLTSDTSTFTIGERTFQGKLTIATLDEKTFTVINELPLEAYLIGVMNSEISSSWPSESIKAQAVAARTYAYATLERTKKTSHLFDIRATVEDQVYHGAHMDDVASAKAVKATAGEMLFKNGKLFVTYYHSCCGGQTEHAHNVWGQGDGPPMVVDRFCKRSPKLTWEYRVPQYLFEQSLQKHGIEIKGLLDLSTTQLPDSPRSSLLLMTDQDRLHTIPATEIRKIFGYQNVKSTWFNIGIENHEVVFAGRGYGHGVGMCQWGAKGMAEEGHNYRNILKFYYSDAELKKIY